MKDCFFNWKEKEDLSDFSIAPVAIAAKSLQLCLTLCDPREGSPPGSPVPGILQARTLEWVAISFSNAWKWKVKVNSLSRVWLSDPVDCSLPGSSVHGIFQARVLEWVAISFSRGSWNPCLPHCRQTLYCLSHRGSPLSHYRNANESHSKVSLYFH